MTFNYHFPKEMIVLFSRSHIMKFKISGQITEFSKPEEMINYERKKNAC